MAAMKMDELAKNMYVLARKHQNRAFTRSLKLTCLDLPGGRLIA